MGELIPFPPPLPPDICRNCKSKSLNAVRGLKICRVCGTFQDYAVLRQYKEFLREIAPRFVSIEDFLILTRQKEGKDGNEKS